MSIPFHGQYTKELLRRAIALVNRPVGRGAVIRIGLIVLFAVIYIAYFLVVAGKEEPSSLEIARVGRHLIGVPFLLYFLLQPYISSHFTASSLWNNLSVRQPLVGEITSQGVSYISPRSRRDIPWERFARIRRADGLVALVTADGVISAFPRSFFSTDKDWEQFQKWVALRVVEAK